MFEVRVSVSASWKQFDSMVFVWYLVWKGYRSKYDFTLMSVLFKMSLGAGALRASSYEPGWPGWLGYQDEFCFGFIWEISARFPRREKVKDPGNEFWRKILPSVTLKAVSLQLNGMLMMWKMQQAMQDDAIRTARIHLAIHPGNRDEVFIWQNFQPAYRDLGWKNRDLGNRASPPSHMNTSKILQRI